MSKSSKTLLVLIAISGLVAVNLFRYAEPLDTFPIMQGERKPDRKLTAENDDNDDSIAQISELEFVQTFSRPLFSEDRRKYVKKVVKQPPKVAKKASPPVKKAAEPPNFEVVGISISGSNAKVLVKMAAKPAPQWFIKGDNIGSWEVVDINKDAMTVSNSGAEVSLALYPENK